VIQAIDAPRGFRGGGGQGKEETGRRESILEITVLVRSECRNKGVRGGRARNKRLTPRLDYVCYTTWFHAIGYLSAQTREGKERVEKKKRKITKNDIQMTRRETAISMKMDDKPVPP